MRNVTDKHYGASGHMLAHLPSCVTFDAMMERFGPPSREFEDTDKGYENTWVFVTGNQHVYRVYDRYGVFRLGGSGMGNPLGFIKWLTVQLGGEVIND